MPKLVHIVDDDASFRQAIRRLLQANGYEAAEYAGAEDFLAHLGERTDPACVLLDVRLPGPSGLEVQAHLSGLGIASPIIFLTGHGDIPTSVRAIKAGAEDFLTKPVSGPELMEAIERAFARYEIEKSKHDWLKEARALLATLTPREREVFDHVVRGRLNKQAAYSLGIAERTIKAHRQRIFEKLGANSVADLVSLAERLGALDEAAPAPPGSPAERTPR